MKFDLLNHFQAPSKGNKIFGKLATLTKYILEVGRYIRILKKKRPNTKYRSTCEQILLSLLGFVLCLLAISNDAPHPPHPHHSYSHTVTLSTIILSFKLQYPGTNSPGRSSCWLRRGRELLEDQSTLCLANIFLILYNLPPPPKKKKLFSPNLLSANKVQTKISLRYNQGQRW